MHEYGVNCKVIKIAEENANQNNALKVTDIYLVVGDMSGFIGESIQMYFDVISQGLYSPYSFSDMDMQLTGHIPTQQPQPQQRLPLFTFVAVFMQFSPQCKFFCNAFNQINCDFFITLF